MKEYLGALLFDIITEDYKDKIEPDKDLISYLKENTKTELLSTYLLYGYAGNVENIVEQIVSLQNKRKEEIVKQIDSFLSYRKLQKSSSKRMFVTRLKKHILKIHIKNWKYMYIT